VRTDLYYGVRPKRQNAFGKLAVSPARQCQQGEVHLDSPKRRRASDRMRLRDVTQAGVRIASCQYIYNLSASALGVGTYRVDIEINGQVVGSGTFGLH
jgi:hypothetical protein